MAIVGPNNLNHDINYTTNFIINGNVYNSGDYDYKFQVKQTQYCPYINTYIKDYTNLVNASTTNFTVTIPYQPEATDPNEVYGAIYLIVVYEKIGMLKTNYCLLLNNLLLQGFESYLTPNINPIDNNFPVGFSIYSDRQGNNSSSGSNIYLNSNLLGYIYGSDSNCSSYSGAGVKGAFYYQNNSLYGLDDDLPDNFMNNSDGLADIKTDINNNDTDFSYEIVNNLWPPPFNEDAIHLNLAYFLTYTTPCDTFSVNLLTEDTIVCKGAGVQLGASGGGTGLSKPAYEWLPTTGLSCSNCANPIASPDSTTCYTVRVWNTDSCSKVLPVRVKVLPQPQFTSMVTTPSACGVSTGGISTSSTGSLAGADSLFSNEVYVGKAPKTLTNLGAGNYTLYLVDTNSCKSEDTTVTINSVNLTNALFTLNPTTGAVPLSVSSDNQSTHATDYSWYFQNDSTTITSPSFEFDTSGTYTITLIAYNNTPDCSDTFSLQIVVYDSLQIIIPNVFTPNGDNQNDVFSIQVNAPCTGTITITNRWGNEMLTKNIATEGKEKILIWNGISTSSMTANTTGSPTGKASDGVYFYSLSLRDKKNKEYRFQGFVELVR
ncbi:MAG: gliding motility-associated C-terminal domain-containing protein [Crocinitomicaceae bacterium]